MAIVLYAISVASHMLSRAPAEKNMTTIEKNITTIGEKKTKTAETQPATKYCHLFPTTKTNTN